MQSALPLSLGLLLALSAHAQNLVPNPSFEMVDTCPQFPLVLGYQPGAVPQYWYSSSDTPDYFNSCEDNDVGGVPNNVFTHQLAHEGGAYSGMASFLAGDHREMIGVELLSDLVVGETYYASFYANAAFGGSQGTGRVCNNLGLLFCTAPYYWIYGSSMPEFGCRNYAHVWSTEVISDTSAWVLVSGSFVADSAYRYMVVGNHFDNANTVTDSLGPNPNAYQLVDQFCVSLNPSECQLINGAGEFSRTWMAVHPNPAKDVFRVSWVGQANRLQVYDMIGRSIWQATTQGDSALVLDVAHWARGHYVMILEGENWYHSHKFVLVE